MTDTTNTFVIFQFNIDHEKQEIEIAKCPVCEGWFGVDATYLDQVSAFIHCPMCSAEVWVYCVDAHLVEFEQLDVPLTDGEWSYGQCCDPGQIMTE